MQAAPPTGFPFYGMPPSVLAHFGTSDAALLARAASAPTGSLLDPAHIALTRYASAQPALAGNTNGVTRMVLHECCGTDATCCIS